MQAWAKLKTLAVADSALVRRDSLMRWMAVMPVLFALLVRWLVPVIDANVSLDLEPYHVLIVSVQCMLMGPLLIGFVFGLMLLEQRGNGTLQAVRVTPVGLPRYLAMRLTLPVMLTTLLTIICIPLTGLMDFRAGLIPACVLGSFWAPIVALLMAAFARNKLQGIVIARITGIPIALPVFAWFVTPPADYGFGVLPSFWPFKAFWLAAEGQAFWLVVLAGAVIHFLLLGFLMNRFRKVLSRE